MSVCECVCECVSTHPPSPPPHTLPHPHPTHTPTPTLTHTLTLTLTLTHKCFTGEPYDTFPLANHKSATSRLVSHWKLWDQRKAKPKTREKRTHFFFQEESTNAFTSFPIGRCGIRERQSQTQEKSTRAFSLRKSQRILLPDFPLEGMGSEKGKAKSKS